MAFLASVVLFVVYIFILLPLLMKLIADHDIPYREAFIRGVLFSLILGVIVWAVPVAFG